jgi:chemotaxis protein CheX
MIEQLCLNDAVLAAAEEVFGTMIFMEVKESAEQQRNVGEGDTILGLISFKGDLEGCLGIHCHLSCAKAIAQSMLGMAPSEELDKAEICDAIGEVANMVMGSIKTRLQETVANLDVSIPTVIKGQKLDNNLSDGTNEASVKLDIAAEHFAEFSLQYRESIN